MKRIILILALFAFSLNQAFAEELSSYYIKLKSGDAADIELRAIKAFGADYCSYDEEKSVLSFDCSELDKYKFLEELRNLALILEEAQEENSYYLTAKLEEAQEEVPEFLGKIYNFDTSRFTAKYLLSLKEIFGGVITGSRKDKVCVKDEDILSIKKKLEDIGFVCSFTDTSILIKEIEYALSVAFDPLLKNEVLAVLRNYAFDIVDLDSKFSFSIKKSNVKFLTEALKSLKQVKSVSMPDNSSFILKAKDMLEYRVRIFLSSKEEVETMIDSLRASDEYIIDNAFENTSAGTLYLELRVLACDTSESRIKSDITQKAKYINSYLRDSDVKIDEI